jgi:XTP/dITP diphosphohydrolase
MPNPSKTVSTLIIATTNHGKLRELKSMLRNTGIRVRDLSAFPQPPEVLENGHSLEANALKKAKTYARVFKLPVLADDSGLFVPALHFRPGVRSARYAGKAADPAANNQKLLKAMLRKNGPDRRAYFACCIALTFPDGRCYTTIGKVWGRLIGELRGEKGFGYDPLFIPAGYGQTFAEMSKTQKNAISHRRKALEKMRPKLIKLLKTVA